MAGPISPDEVVKVQREMIPNFVFDAFNELIAQNINTCGRAVIKVKDVIPAITTHAAKIGVEIKRGDIFDKGWLEVEDSYREKGWQVKYSQPVAWGGESFDAHYEFTPKRGNHAER